MIRLVEAPAAGLENVEMIKENTKKFLLDVRITFKELQKLA